LKITVVLDDEDDRQSILHGLDHCFEEFTLARRRIADRAQDHAVIPREFEAPRRANGGQALRCSWRRRWIDAQPTVRAVYRHLAATRRRFGRSQMLPGHFERRHAARLHQRAIAVVKEQQVVLLERRRQCGKRLVALAGDVNPAAALAQEAFFAHVTGANQEEFAK
jgi:hypothetical protein